MQRPLDRRAFITTAVLAAAAWSHRARAADGMFVSLNGSLTRQMAWPEFAALASKLGYPGVDVNLAAALKDGPAATRERLSRLRLRPGIASLPVRYSNQDEALVEEDMKGLDAAARFLAEIGCPRMMAVLPPSSTIPKPEFRALLAGRVQRIAEVLNGSNVRLGLEFLGPLHFRTRNPHEFIWRMDEALEFATGCGANVGLTLDAWHWHHAGAGAADILAAGRSRIVHVHVSDARRQPPEEVRDNARLFPGEGIIDLTTFFESLVKIGYTDAVSPEPIGRVPAEMSPEEGARLGLETTRAVMKRASVFGRLGAL